MVVGAMDSNRLPSQSLQIQSVLQKLASISSKNALDIATGNGVFIRMLMKTLNQYESFSGVDTNQKSLNQGIRTFKKNSVRFFNMNAENLEFKADTFDLVSISESLHHLKNPTTALIEIKRVLKQNCFLILQESFSDFDQAQSQISDVLIHEFIAKIDILRGFYHNRFYLRQEIVKMLEEAGFHNNEVHILELPLKCILCKYKDYCTDSMSKKMINIGLRAINKSLNEIRGFTEYNELKIEAKGIREKIHKNGYCPASVLFAFVRK